MEAVKTDKAHNNLFFCDRVSWYNKEVSKVLLTSAEGL